MKGILVFVLLLALGNGATFDEDYDLPLEWKDYDNFYDYGMVREEAEKVLPKSNEDTQIDQKVEEDIEKYKNEEFHDIDTNYQIEDNRSDADKEHTVEDIVQSTLVEVKEKSNELDLNDYNLLWGEGDIKDVKASQENTEKKDEESVIDEEIYKEPKAAADNDYHLLWGDDDIAPVPISEENDNIKDELDIPFESDDEKDALDEAVPEIPAEKVDENILKETLELLSEDENDGNDLDNLPLPVPGDENLNEDILKETKDILDDVDNMESVPEDVKQNIEDIVDETKKLLEEGDSPNEENIPEQKEENLEHEIAKLADEIDKAEDRLENSDEDTVDDAMDNLNEDLDKLFDTLDKLKEGIEEAGGKAQQKIEEVFGSDENDWFDDDNDEIYENIEDSNLSEIFGKSNTHSSEEDVEEDADDDVAKENLDDVIKEILEEEDKINSSFEKENPDKNKENASKEDSVESIQDEIPIMYQNDALLDGDSKQDDSLVEQFNADVLDKDLANETSIENLVNEDKEKEKITDRKPKINMVDELTSEELDVLMEQFKLVHSDDLEIKSEPTPIHIKLSVDEPVVITSPNYPNPYPTNNVIDWMFEGDGTGIEFIIHDFAVNGALGDYLLVKPGGIDESGQDGLVFSYRLNSERKYRFMDVNRMFVRFNANLGMMFLRGFQFSVRMISPPSALEDTNLPQPEELLVPHEDNLTLILGGLSIIDFYDVKEDFRQILADMADRYVSENDIDPGLNTTSEVTKIIKTAVCNIRWPDYDKCVEVTFAVPLQYDNESADYRLSEKDLKAMWHAFYNEEPFTTRLTQLSIAEFVIPDSRTAMTAWSVIAFGVLISVAMLAFGLWRYSCFEDYTRMRAFDNDSVQNEKRTLDLYPTPHQTLPPLYAESEYKWHDSYDDSTRVDMGGFANKSYIRDELYGFDSDEDVVHTRERGLEFNPRDSDV